MKFVAATLLSLAALASAVRPHPKPLAVNNVPADSDLGMKILSKARRVQDEGDYYDNANNYWNNNYGEEEHYYNNAGNQAYGGGNGGNQGGYMDWYGQYDNAWANQNQQQFQNWFMSMHTWVKDYSIKFQGCHHVTEWNREAEDEDDVRIYTRRLVKFRLCPSYSCLDSSAEGCDSGYGDYIIDLEMFLMAYLEAREQYQEWMEDQAQENGYQYYGNNYGDWDMEQYMYCQQADVDYDMDENQNYQYYQGQGQDGDWDGEMFMGPYCASQGGAVYVGLFTDEMCSQPVDSNYGRSIYYNDKGETLPFSGTSLVEMSCFPCSEPDGQYAYYNNQGNDQEDDDEVCEACEMLYTYSGKCEENLPISSNTQNNKACNYLEGIKVIRKDGTVLTTNRAGGGSKRGSKGQSYKGALAFVAIFSAAFIALSAYVYYLKEKLDRASIQLAE